MFQILGGVLLQKIIKIEKIRIQFLLRNFQNHVLVLKFIMGTSLEIIL